MSFINYQATRQRRINDYIQSSLPSIDNKPTKLHQALHYSVFNGGKRLRPLLVYATGESFEVPIHYLDSIACAIELIHCYSLVHDDLPAMDDSPLRRGIPSCHKAFDEATAILVGDALQAEAFTQLSRLEEFIDAACCLRMVSVLAHACGVQEMVAGQSLDLDNTHGNLAIEELEIIYQKKTGALIQASLIMGALAYEKITKNEINILTNLGKHLGLAFQIMDDILDTSTPTEILGKPQGLDITHQKTTYVTLLGVENAKKQARKETDLALSFLNFLPTKKPYLNDVISHMLNRKY